MAAIVDTLKAPGLTFREEPLPEHRVFVDVVINEIEYVAELAPHATLVDKFILVAFDTRSELEDWA